MKITGIEILPLTISFKGKIKESFGTVGLREDDVVIRLGEGSTLGPFYSGESQETVMGIIAHHIFPRVLEGQDPFNIDPIHCQMNKTVYANTVAKAAVDFALQSLHHRFFVHFGRNHEERRVLGRIVTPHPLEDLHPFHLRHVPIADHYVNAALLQLGQGVGSVRCFRNMLKAVRFEHIRDRSTHIEVIVHHEHP